MTEQTQTQRKVKVDLHMHGPIGFQEFWLKDQGYGGKNLLRLIADSCLDKGVGITAITSDEDEIPRGSIHDRFNYLINKFALTLPKGYEFSRFGKNIGIVARNDEQLFILNAQNVRTNDEGKQVGYNVIGTNKIPNHRDLVETIKLVNDKNSDEEGYLIGGPEHAFCDAHHGIGDKEKLAKLLPLMSFVEGHDAQIIWNVSEKIPVFGKYRRGINDLAQEFAQNYKKPWIAVSNAHRIKDAGIAYVEFDFDKLDMTNPAKFSKSLKTVVESNEFTNHCGYQSKAGWLDWVSSYAWGTKLGLDKKSEREMMQNKTWN